MRRSLRTKVIERAHGHCEYCLLPQHLTVLPLEIDHVRAIQHGGKTTLNNLCFACAACNAFKGPNASGFDPLTDELVRLFNPRTDVWDDHFEWVAASLVGKTAIGRATVQVLNVNQRERVAHRALLVAAGDVDLR